MKGILLIAVFILSTIALTIPISAATTYYVDDAGDDGNDGSSGSPWLTIQHAIDTATAGDTIIVEEGTYTENIDIPEGKDGLELMGAIEVTVTIITTSVGTAPIATTNILIQSSDVKLHGFTIESPTAGDGEYVTLIHILHGTGVEIYDNILKLDADHANAELVALVTAEEDLSGLYIHDNTFEATSTSAGSWLEGIYINTQLGAPTGYVTIEHNDFTGKLTRGIATERSKTIIHGNTIDTAGVTSPHIGIDIAMPYEGAAAYPQGVSDVLVEDNIVTGFIWGIRLGRNGEIAGQDLSDIVLTGNEVDGTEYAINVLYDADGITVYNNNILDDIDNADTDVELDATHNWWGTAVEGDVEDAAGLDVDFDLWLQNAIEDGNLDSLFYQTGDTVTITVYDNAHSENDDPIRTDIIEEAVTITSTTDTTGFLLDLTETGINTGKFTASFQLVAPVEPGIEELGVNDGDTISQNYGGTAGLAIVDDVAPVVTITAPAADSDISGESVTVSATVIDDNEPSVTYSFKIDGVQFDTDNAASLNTTKYSDGEHTITVQATDGAGNSGSELITVNIDNTIPVVAASVSSPPVVPPDLDVEITITAYVSDAGTEVASVTIDLSDVSGAVDAAMLDDGNPPDETDADGVYTVDITLPGDLTVGLYNFTITATDTEGNINNEEILVLQVIADAVDPIISSASVEYDLGAVSARPEDDITVTVIATDDLSGVASVSIDASAIGLSETEDMGDPTDDTWAVTLTVHVDTEVGTKTLNITATDYALNEVFVLVEVEVTADLEGFFIYLDAGWNLISLPLIPNDSSIDVILADIIESVDVVWSYEGGNWTNYRSGGPDSELTVMVDGNGYWINMTEAATLTIYGLEFLPPPETPHAYDLGVGWNLMGYKGISTTTMADAYLGSAYDDCDRIWAYYDGAYQGVAYNDVMIPGRGYWIAMSAEGTIYP